MNPSKAEAVVSAHGALTVHQRSAVWHLLTATAVSVVALSGCGTTGIITHDDSTYSVAVQYGSLSDSWDTERAEAVSKANAFCARKKGAYVFLKEDRSGAYGFTPQASKITFSCGLIPLALVQTADVQTADVQCKDKFQAPELDPIRHKVELYRDVADAGPTFEIASDDTFPTQADLPVISRWASLRDECLHRLNAAPALPPGATAMQIAFIQQDTAFGRETAARVSELIVALYYKKLTYGEFAQKRYEIERAGSAAERAFRRSALEGNQQRQLQAQQLAQQQFANDLAAWSVYMKAVNARQPQTVHINGMIEVQ
jgi:hypothetical protein